MNRDLTQMTDSEFDLVVIGGGIFGACAAWDAAQRGLSVALIDRGDFCNATSANHLKVVHGGIRYLQHLDLPRVRESCRERSALLRVAPHLVQPLPIIMPTYGRGSEGRLVLGTGFALYDLLTFDRNAGIGDPDRRIPRGRILSRDHCLELLPDLASKGLTGAGLFYDGLFYNPPRLVLAFLRSAVTAGARVANYAEAIGFVHDGDRVLGVTVRDRFSDEQFEVRGRVVLNAAGPWAPTLLGSALQIRLQPQPTFSRDVGFVVRGRRTGNHALACRIQSKDRDAVLSRKGRHIFLVPWQDFTLVGVWHVVHTKGPDEFEVREEEMQQFFDELNGDYAGLGLRPEEVLMVYAGLTLFGTVLPGQQDLRFGHRSLLVDHAGEHGMQGLVTLIGVRATTARGMAERAVDLILTKLGSRPRPSRTGVTPVHGGRIERFEELVQEATRRHGCQYGDDVIRALVHNHGSEYETVLRYIDKDEDLGTMIATSRTLKAEITHAIREEMALSLTDVVFRRTNLASGGHPGEEVLEECARLMSNELKWGKDRLERELEDVRAQFRCHQAVRT